MKTRIKEEIGSYTISYPFIFEGLKKISPVAQKIELKSKKVLGLIYIIKQ